jgi:tetratricopeptide (TPR) repeat protein
VTRRLVPSVAAPILAVGLLAGCRQPVEPVGLKADAVAAGDAAFAAERFSDAVAAYRRATDVDPKDGPLRLKLAKAYERAQQWTQAGQEAMRAVDLLPGDYEAGRLAARLVLSLSRFEDSLSITTNLLRDRPDDVDLLVLWGTATARLSNPYWAIYRLGTTGGRGEAYERGVTNLRPAVGENRDKAAEDALRRALTITPRDFNGRFALAGLLWATRRADESEALLAGLASDFPQHAMVNEAAGYFFLARGRDDEGERYLKNAAASPSPEGRGPRTTLADRFLASERFADVIALLQHAPASDDEGGAVAIRRAEATLGLGRHAEAAQQLDALLVRYPSHGRARVLKARLQLQTRDAAGAFDTAGRAVKADPADGEARLELARALEALGDMDLAYKEYGEALRLRPTAVDLPRVLARLALRTGHDRAALAYARQASQRFPDDLGTRLILVEAYIRTGELANADRQLAPLVTAPAAPSADALVLLGRLRLARGDHRATRAAFEEALRLAPDSTSALTALVELDLTQGQLDDAGRRVTSASISRPDDVAILRLLGRVQRTQGDLSVAEATFRRALALQPADTDSALLLAESLADSRRIEEARRLLEQVLQRRPSSLAAQTAMGGTLEALGRFDDAQERYETILAEYPDAVDAASRLAILMVSRGRNLSSALNVLSEARRAAPGDARVSDAYGWVQLHREQIPLALQHLQAATLQEPRNPSYQYHLGVAYMRAGRFAQARSALTQALALDPAFPERDRVNAELGKLPR